MVIRSRCTIKKAVSCEWKPPSSDLPNLEFIAPKKANPRQRRAEIRRRSAAITRQFALLRAHGLLRKLPRIRRYHLTAKGRRIITALLAACDANVEQLTKLAA